MTFFCLLDTPDSGVIDFDDRTPWPKVVFPQVWEAVSIASFAPKRGNSTIVTTFDVVREWQEELAGNLRYVPFEPRAPRALRINGIPVVADPTCPPNTLYLVNEGWAEVLAEAIIKREKEK